MYSTTEPITSIGYIIDNTLKDEISQWINSLGYDHQKFISSDKAIDILGSFVIVFCNNDDLLVMFKLVWPGCIGPSLKISTTVK